MNKSIQTHSPMTSPKRSAGAALVVALVLLLLITLLGLSGLRTGQMEERMSANALDRALAFQAAEAALRTAEDTIPAARLAGTVPNDLAAADYTDNACTVSACADGICARPDSVCTDRWTDSTFDDWIDGPTAGSGALAIASQYFIEAVSRNTPCESKIIVQDLSGTCTTFRVTARNAPQAGRSQVILQTTFVWPN